MGDSEKENSKDISYTFELESELSALVAKNVISPKIADKLGKKLKEKNVKITKEQLNTLVEKINSIMKNYKNLETSEKKPVATTKQITPVKPDENMQKLVETIEKLETRINNLENLLSEKQDTKIVTTNDIKLPDGKEINTNWTLEPLTEIPNDPESVVILMKWLQYLIDKCGRENLSNILDYYVDIGWISQDAKINLIEYSHGITDEGKKGEHTTTTKKINDLPSRDHIQSFVFIQKLKGIQLDKHFIEKIDGEITRLTKKLDNYNFK